MTPVIALYHRLLYTLLDILEAMLTIRVLLRMFGANPASPFVAWIHAMTDPFVAPFAGIFPSPAAGIDVAALVAMLAYALLVYALVRLLDAVLLPTLPERHRVVRTEEVL